MLAYQTAPGPYGCYKFAVKIVTEGLVPGSNLAIIGGRLVAIAQAADYGCSKHSDPSGQKNQDQPEQRVKQHVGSGNFAHAEINWNTTPSPKFLRICH